ncbi:MAG: hypothetical protein ACR2FY_15625 [Pirellulaceae bacterium]
MPRSFLRSFVFTLGGILLLFAAAAKLQDSWMNEFWRELAVVPPQLLLLVSLAEIFVGAWLFVAAIAPFLGGRGGALTEGAWLVGTSLYSLLTLGATVLAHSGAPRCDCMGAFSVTPAVMIAVDFAVLCSPRNFPATASEINRCKRPPLDTVASRIRSFGNNLRNSLAHWRR